MASMSARPRPRPWRKMIIGATVGAPPVTLGTAMSTLIVSAAALLGSGLNAPVAGLIRLKVVMVASRNSLTLSCGTPWLRPYLVKAAVGVSAVTAPGTAVAFGVV